MYDFHRPSIAQNDKTFIKKIIQNIFLQYAIWWYRCLNHCATIKSHEHCAAIAAAAAVHSQPHTHTNLTSSVCEICGRRTGCLFIACVGCRRKLSPSPDALCLFQPMLNTNGTHYSFLCLSFFPIYLWLIVYMHRARAYFHSIKFPEELATSTLQHWQMRNSTHTHTRARSSYTRYTRLPHQSQSKVQVRWNVRDPHQSVKTPSTKWFRLSCWGAAVCIFRFLFFFFSRRITNRVIFVPGCRLVKNCIQYFEFCAKCKDFECVPIVAFFFHIIFWLLCVFSKFPAFFLSDFLVMNI